MSEDKKPKIDLKARLAKKDAGAAPAAEPAAAPARESLPSAVPGPAPLPIPPPSAPAMMPGLPVPPGMSSPAADAGNPLMAAVAPRPSAMPVAPAAPPAPTRIEVDELAVQEAAAKARKSGFVIAGIAAVLFAGVGFVAGGASEQGAARKKSSTDAQDLKKDVEKAKGQLEDLVKKVEASKAMLASKDPKERKFPETLDTELGAINVDFDGGKLAGRRFSGYSPEVSKALFDFVASVSTVNDHKTALKNLVSKLKKPMKEQLAAAADGSHAISHIVLLGGPTGKDPGGNYVGNIAVLSPPLKFTGDQPTIDKDFTATFSGKNISVGKYKSGDLSQPSAIYVTPSSFEAACPSETKSQTAQLGFKLSDLISEIKGEGPADPNMASDTKAGLIEQADKLMKALEKI